MVQRKRQNESKVKTKAKEKETKPKKKLGAPQFKWTKELEDEIFFRIATEPKSILTILSDKPEFPGKETFYKRMFNDEVFAERYDKCKRMQQDIKIESQNIVLERVRKEHTYIDQAGNVKLDSAAVALAKLELDNIKWEAARLGRTKWGDCASETEKGIKSIKDDIARLADGKNPHEKEY